jgi:predicted pyridoxine 5'-phosphate oxidase superfamily flavin-nucleotide-binding protein
MDDQPLTDLDSVMRRTAATSGEVIRHSFPPEKRLDARQLAEFWGEGRIAVLATVSPAGRPSAAPVVVYLHSARFYFQCEPKAVKLRDVRANRSVALTAWAPDGQAAIVQGTAREVAADERRSLPAHLGADGPFGPATPVEITPTHITFGRPPVLES